MSFIYIKFLWLIQLAVQSRLSFKHKNINKAVKESLFLSCKKRGGLEGLVLP